MNGLIYLDKKQLFEIDAGKGVVDIVSGVTVVAGGVYLIGYGIGEAIS